MHILMKKFGQGDSHVLAGALSGRKVHAELVELTAREPGEPQPVFLDFDGVDVATASFLRESILNFRDTVRSRRSNYYPVIANASELVADELNVLLAPRRDVLMLCSLDKNEKPSKARLLGDLDPKQHVTFELVKKRGETTAAELHAHHGDGAVQNAWNNRLAALAGLGLIVELSQGRTKRYRPLLNGVA